MNDSPGNCILTRTNFASVELRHTIDSHHQSFTTDFDGVIYGKVRSYGGGSGIVYLNDAAIVDGSSTSNYSFIFLPFANGDTISSRSDKSAGEYHVGIYKYNLFKGLQRI